MALAIPPRFDQVVQPYSMQTSQSRVLVNRRLNTEWSTAPVSAGRSVTTRALPCVRESPRVGHVVGTVAEEGPWDHQVERHARIGEDDRLRVTSRPRGVRQLEGIAEPFDVLAGVGAFRAIEHLVPALPLVRWRQPLGSALWYGQRVSTRIGSAQYIRRCLVAHDIIRREHARALGGGNEVAQLLAARAWVDRDSRKTRLRAGDQRVDELGVVAKHDRRSVALAEHDTPQRMRQLVGLDGNLGVGESAGRSPFSNTRQHRSGSASARAATRRPSTAASSGSAMARAYRYSTWTAQAAASVPIAAHTRITLEASRRVPVPARIERLGGRSLQVDAVPKAD